MTHPRPVRRDVAALNFGIEEEFMLLDRSTLRPDPRALEVLLSLKRDAVLAPHAASEFLASQVEHSSPVFSSLDQARASLLGYRRALAAAADRIGAQAVGSGTPFDADVFPDVTEALRYRRVVSQFGAVIADHQITGTHVHVEVPDRETGVAVLNRVRPWLPVLLAVTANSPWWRATDSGFGSWRTILMRKWVTASCPPEFRGAADYDARLAALVGIGGTVDVHTVAWNARLSEAYPTVEFRIFDAQLAADDAVFAAGLCRGLVAAALVEEEAGTAMREVTPELLDAALWHAARDGLLGDLVDPEAGILRPAREVVDLLLHKISGVTAEADQRYLESAADRAFLSGTGAERQRVAYIDGGGDSGGDAGGEAAAGGREALLSLYSESLMRD